MEANTPTPLQPTTDSNQSSAAVSKPQTIRAFEAALRGLGFSRAEAAAIAARGYRASLSAESQERDEMDELAAAAENFKNAFKL